MGFARGALTRSSGSLFSPSSTLPLRCTSAVSPPRRVLFDLVLHSTFPPSGSLITPYGDDLRFQRALPQSVRVARTCGARTAPILVSCQLAIAHWVAIAMLQRSTLTTMVRGMRQEEEGRKVANALDTIDVQPPPRRDAWQGSGTQRGARQQPKRAQARFLPPPFGMQSVALVLAKQSAHRASKSHREECAYRRLARLHEEQTQSREESLQIVLRRQVRRSPLLYRRRWRTRWRRRRHPPRRGGVRALRMKLVGFGTLSSSFLMAIHHLSSVRVRAVLSMGIGSRVVDRLPVIVMVVTALATAAAAEHRRMAAPLGQLETACRLQHRGVAVVVQPIDGTRLLRWEVARWRS